MKRSDVPNWLVAVAWLVMAGICTTIGYLGGSTKSHSAFVADKPEVVTVAKVPTLTGFNITWSGDGTLAVPSQVAPGDYLVSPNDNAIGCLWQRLKSKDTRNVKNIIQNGLMNRGATPQMVKIDAKDKFFQLLGCSFRKVS